MAYQFENDDHQEVVFGKAGTIVHYPKVVGTGPVAVTGTPTYILLDHNGDQVDSGTITPTPTSDPDLANDLLSYAAPSTLDRGMGYELHIDWLFGTDPHKSVVRFDVVRYPWRDVLVGLNELRAVRADIDSPLLRLATKLNLAGNDEVKTEAAASIMARQAKVELAEWIATTADGLGAMQPDLVIDRNKLVPTLAHLTCAHMYASIAKDPRGGEDGDSAQVRYQRSQANERYKTSGALKYDRDKDGFGEDERNAGAASIVPTRRQS